MSPLYPSNSTVRERNRLFTTISKTYIFNVPNNKINILLKYIFNVPSNKFNIFRQVNKSAL